MNMGGLHNGKITSGITTTLSKKTIEFVYSMLTEWRDDPDRPVEEAEPRLNLQLCKFLTSRKIRDLYPMVSFIHEEYQNSRRSVDLSALPTERTLIDAKQYSIYDPFLVFECKRLPAPEKRRAREYVTGGKDETTGGIQRFKIGAHGAKLNQAVMIGYIQKSSPKAWHDNINKWITELAKGKMEDACDWNTNEALKLLNEDNSKGLANYWSLHNRTNSKLSSKIKINHLWVVMHGNN